MNKNDSLENFFTLHPKRCSEYEENDGLITVLYRKQNLGWLDRHIFKKWASKPRKIDLDKTGSFVWEKCDGSLSVGEIADELKREMGEDFEKPRERVKLFIEQLFKNKLIVLYKKVEENNL